MGQKDTSVPEEPAVPVLIIIIIIIIIIEEQVKEVR